MKLAIVGFGKMARERHVPAIAATPEIDLVAIASPHGGLDGIPWFPTLEALIGSDVNVDAVAICTPPLVRQHEATLALEAGYHVLLERPPGATVSGITALCAVARGASLTLFGTWESRYANAVERAASLVAEHGVRSIDITWRENVRLSYPGKDWVWQQGALGVFETGIGAIAILTAIVPDTLFVTAADLFMPANRAAPIAATLVLATESGIDVTAAFDFHPGQEQLWEIEVNCDAGTFALSRSGSILTMDGRILADGPVRRHQDIYRRFLDLVQTGVSDVDTRPLALVEDAFMLGGRTVVAPFEH